MTQPKTKMRASPRALRKGALATARPVGDARAIAARVARESYGKLVAYLAATSRNDDGSWHVLQPLQIRSSHGLIDFMPDETYTEGHEKLGLDIAKLLNANCAKK